MGAAMRARRCPGCGDRFYVNPEAPSAECQNCSGDFDPSAQAKQDAENIARVNDARVFGGRKQTMDLKSLQDAQALQNQRDAAAVADAIATQAPKGKRSNG